MNGKIQTHLMMLISFLLCNTSSMVLAACTAIAADEEMSIPRESALPETLRFEGEVVEMLPPSKAIHNTATLRGKRFEWLGQVEKGVAEDGRLTTVDGAPDIGSSKAGPRE